MYAMTLITTISYAVESNGKKTFTILHTNDMHSSFIGMGPVGIAPLPLPPVIPVYERTAEVRAIKAD
jgi:hypothetical protein